MYLSASYILSGDMACENMERTTALGTENRTYSDYENGLQLLATVVQIWAASMLYNPPSEYDQNKRDHSIRNYWVTKVDSYLKIEIKDLILGLTINPAVAVDRFEATQQSHDCGTTILQGLGETGMIKDAATILCQIFIDHSDIRSLGRLYGINPELIEGCNLEDMHAIASFVFKKALLETPMHGDLTATILGADMQKYVAYYIANPE